MRLLFAPFLSAAPFGAFPCAALRRAPEAGLRGALFGRALARESGRATASFRRAAGAFPLVPPVVPPERTAPLTFAGAVSTLRAFVGAFDGGCITGGAIIVLRTARSTTGAPPRRGSSVRGGAMVVARAGRVPGRALAFRVSALLPAAVRAVVRDAAAFEGLVVVAREPAAPATFVTVAATALPATGFETVRRRRPLAAEATASAIAGTTAGSLGAPSRTTASAARPRFAPSRGAGVSVG